MVNLTWKRTIRIQTHNPGSNYTRGFKVRAAQMLKPAKMASATRWRGQSAQLEILSSLTLRVSNCPEFAHPHELRGPGFKGPLPTSATASGKARSCASVAIASNAINYSQTTTSADEYEGNRWIVDFGEQHL
jgi:hypothetical protein